MGTLVTVTLPEESEDVADDIFSLIYGIEREISFHLEDSLISQVNSASGICPVALPDDVYALVKASVEMAYQTEGAFNPALGPVTALWAMGTEEARIPEKEEIAAALPLTDYTAIEFSDEERSVFLPLPGMALDLGGVGKGYAADKVRELLQERGVESAIVNIGGNVLAYGRGEGGRDWKIGLRNPFGGGESAFRSVDAADACVITSGVYQRYIEKDGVRYHHILSSRTGYPADSDIVSASIISSSGTLGDMLSTAVLASGSEKAMSLASEYPVRCIIVLDDGSVFDSDGPDGKIAVPEK